MKLHTTRIRQRKEGLLKSTPNTMQGLTIDKNAVHPLKKKKVVHLE